MGAGGCGRRSFDFLPFRPSLRFKFENLHFIAVIRKEKRKKKRRENSSSTRILHSLFMAAKVDNRYRIFLCSFLRTFCLIFTFTSVPGTTNGTNVKTREMTAARTVSAVTVFFSRRINRPCRRVKNGPNLRRIYHRCAENGSISRIKRRIPYLLIAVLYQRGEKEKYNSAESFHFSQKSIPYFWISIERR